MGDLTLRGATSGSITLSPTAVAGTNTITLPASTGTVALTASPTFTGTVTATTVTSPSATALTIQSAGATAMTIDTSQNVGFGTTSPATYGKFVSFGAYPQIVAAASSGNSAQIQIYSNGATANDFRIGQGYISNTDGIAFVSNQANAALVFRTNATEQARIDSSGNLLVGTTNSSATNTNGIAVLGPTGGTTISVGHINGTANGSSYYYMLYNGTVIGTISQNGTTAVAYNTTSDYRLKENVTPMTGGLATVNVLNPVTYDWVSDKSAGEGFIAHELAEVVPLAVNGEKDAVNEDGSIKPQGVDYSKIVVHLVAAIQELSAKNDALEARLAALEAK